MLCLGSEPHLNASLVIHVFAVVERQRCGAPALWGLDGGGVPRCLPSCSPGPKVGYSSLVLSDRELIPNKRCLKYQPQAHQPASVE